MRESKHENKLGMFIHWGLYSMLGMHEQALARYDMDSREYEELQKHFDPVLYDPEKWVLLAKASGMKYICFTTKHHDGFCMWDTKCTDYNVMNTPYGKDTLKMLADACKKHGMLLSLYYSNPDWHHPLAYNPASSHQWKAKNKDNTDTEEYRQFIKAQITELLTNYGDIYTLFWDIPPKVYDESLNELVRRLQPDIFINDRGWSEGDFSTPERDYEGACTKRFAHMTEACNSVGQESWGYRSNEDFYSKRYLTSSIDRYMALGASYLLNVGPNAEGVICEEYESRIRKVGDWYLRTEGCLESAEEDPFDYASLKNNCIATKKNGKTYLHFYEGLISDAVILEKYPRLPKSVRLLNTDEFLNFDEIQVPEFFVEEFERFEKKSLHIYRIDIDRIEGEPVILEIDWG